MKEEFTINIKENHLKFGEKQIIACLINDEETYSGQKKDIIRLMSLDDKQIQNVNFDGVYEELKKAGYITGKADHTYIMSPVSESNKFSEGYVNCTGLIVSGKDKITGKYISFLTHQNPRYFLSSLKSEFVFDLQNRMHEIKERCEDGTIDALVFGGMYDDLDPEGIISEKYDESIELITSEVEKTLGFAPQTVNGPKIDNLFGGIGKDNFYFDNEKRNAYFIRPKVNKNI